MVSMFITSLRRPRPQQGCGGTLTPLLEFEWRIGIQGVGDADVQGEVGI